MWLIDLFGLSVKEAARTVPALYQHLLDRVKPERDSKPALGRDWWLFPRVRQTFRTALVGLSRYIVTVETTKHRIFQFLPAEVAPDHSTIAIASADAFHLGVLSSRIHAVWALAAGGTLEDRPRYNKSVCFDPFPFPEASPALRARIAHCAELLDAHRKRQQAMYPELTLTGMYNVLAALRQKRALTEKEQDIHQRALTSILRELHDAIDEAVAEACGWPADLDDEGILERIVALNRERADEERAGRVRWLRPDFQAPGEVAPEQHGLGLPTGGEEEAIGPMTKLPWPKGVRERVAAVRATVTVPMTAEQVTACFKGAKRADVEVILESLASVGVLIIDAQGRYLP